MSRALRPRSIMWVRAADEHRSFTGKVRHVGVYAPDTPGTVLIQVGRWVPLCGLYRSVQVWRWVMPENVARLPICASCASTHAGITLELAAAAATLSAPGPSSAARVPAS